jgi:anti-sigma28 factor (negative regulator of flagellin synthesis)
MAGTSPQKMDDKDLLAEQFAENLRAAAAAVNNKVGKDEESRIEKLRLKVLNGEYQISAKDIASKIIDEHLP